MTGEELRQRINRLGLSYVEAATRLGLTAAGLHHQMRGERPVGRQTELLLQRLEDDHGRAQQDRSRSAPPDQRWLRLAGKLRANRQQGDGEN